MMEEVDEKLIDDNDHASDDGSTRSKDSKKKAPKAAVKLASIRETFSFAFETGPKTKLAFFFGTLGGIGNGLVSFLVIAKQILFLEPTDFIPLTFP